MSPLSSLFLPALLLLNQAVAAPAFGLDFHTSSPSLPSSSLPSPDPSTSLQYVVLGLGTQNYTCADSTDASKPVAIGAVAKLYDATKAVSAPYIGHWISKKLTCAADKHNSSLGLKRIGNHYFTAAGVPTFDLSIGTTSSKYPQGRQLSGKKVAQAAAPAEACEGRSGAAAVPWLTLDDNADGTTRGLKRVYRVNTTGGSAPSTCAGQAAAFQVDYAAEYWFYD